MSTFRIFSLTILLVFCPRTNADEDEFKGLKSCTVNLIRTMFSSDSTLVVVMENSSQFDRQQVSNPIVLLYLSGEFSSSLTSYRNFLIYAKNVTYLNEGLTKLKNGNVWNPNLSSRGRFIIVTSVGQVRDVFKSLWSSDIVNALVLADEDGVPQTYEADITAQNNKCGRQVAVVTKSECGGDLNVTFNRKGLGKLSHCPIQVTNLLHYKQSSPTTALNVRILTMLMEILDTRLATGNSSNTDVTLHIHIDGVSPRRVGWYGDDRHIFFSRRLWVVPETHRLALINFSYDTYVWIIFPATLTAVVVAWWTVDSLNHRSHLLKLWLSVLAYVLGGLDHLVPRRYNPRVLITLYVVYYTLMFVSFQQNFRADLRTPKVSGSHSPVAVEDLASIKLRTNITAYFFEDPITDVYNFLRYRNATSILTMFSLKTYFGHDRNPSIDYVDSEQPVTFWLRVRKGHYLLPWIDKGLTYMHEHGFYKKVTMEDQAVVPPPRKYLRVLAVRQLFAIFMALGMGLCLAFVVFVLELVVYRASPVDHRQGYFVE